jgi:hypothetical protein
VPCADLPLMRHLTRHPTPPPSFSADRSSTLPLPDDDCSAEVSVALVDFRCERPPSLHPQTQFPGVARGPVSSHQYRTDPPSFPHSWRHGVGRSVTH